ncbi:MAG: serine hydrolase domain-containing protein [Gaiellales bacterium]
MNVPIAELDNLFTTATGTGGVPGVIAALADRDGTRYMRSFGTVDVRTGAPMPDDAVLRIASLSKAVAAIAALQLIEQGRLALDTPVGEILPAFDDVKVLEGFDGDRPLLHPPAIRPTVRHLMTHTSGLTYDAFNADLLRYAEVTGVPMPVTGQLIAFGSPMVCEPGSRFAYGMSTDWTGRVIEAVSGLSLEEYFRRHISDPLGITDLTFSPTAEQWRRVAPVHLIAADGSAQVIDFELPTEREFDPAGHGLYATAGDYLKIQRLLLRGGELDGARLLQERTVREMFTNQIGELVPGRHVSARPEFSRDLQFRPGSKWGLDIMVTETPVPGLRPAGSGGWCGTFNNFYWIDPVTGITGALHASYLPLCDERVVDLFETFERTVYASA